MRHLNYVIKQNKLFSSPNYFLPRLGSSSIRRVLAALLLLLSGATLARADTALVFNEINYHPATNEAAMQWIEFYNQMTVDLDVSNWKVSGDVEFTFPDQTRIAGRSYLVLARNPAQLQSATGLSSNLFGPFTGALKKGGGSLSLNNNSGRLMDQIVFGADGAWPVTPDGGGVTLAKIDRDWSSAPASNWTASRTMGGTPALANSVATNQTFTVAFNEISGSTNTGFWLELINYGSNPVSLGNAILSHVGATNREYVFASNVTLNPGACLVLSNNILGFANPTAGDQLFLFGANRSAVYDGVVLQAGARGRSPDGTGSWFVPNVATTGTSNSFSFRTELVINEVMYNHAAFPIADTNSLPQDNPEEWIEIYNRGSQSVDLSGWKVGGDIGYAFAAGKTIAPAAYLVVARDAAVLLATYPNIDIVGNYTSRLGSGEQIVLVDPLGNPANKVHYHSGGAWPEAASGGGSSLELRNPNSDNSKPEAWAASKESGKSSWQTMTYRMVAQASATPNPDNLWRDFVMGLLGAGECWIDDLSVIQSPESNPVQLVTNGNFENGLTGWRLPGNHRNSSLEIDPENPSNHVLRVVAAGAQEHMHNHIETTLARQVTNGVLYEISYRARWITGNPLLNTRLYFNRVAQTTRLSVPPLNGTPGAVNSTFETNIGPTFSQFQHQPVVPPGSLPVTVSVRVQDPQGVASCVLWWSFNGGLWSTSAMTASNGVYAGTIPGLPANSLVQFYVRATDASGATSTYPARGSNSGAFYRVNDGLANVAQAHTFRILMSPANVALQYATTNLMSNENLPCTVIYDERKVFYDASVRLKSSQRGRVESGRIGFHIQFNPDDLFRGVHPVLLMDRSAGGGRPAQEEILLKHMLSRAGIPMVNSDLCRVIAPQPAQNGWAILSPRYEDEFAEATFQNGDDGTLYELELTYFPTTANAAGYKLPAPDDVQGVDISDRGTDKENYRYNLIIKNHRSTDDYSALIQFARGWSLNGSALDVQTRSSMDVDQWLRAYAMISLGGVGDMYTFGNNHNFMLYRRPEDGKFLYLPWDMDFLFSRPTIASLVGDQNLGKIVNLPGNLRRFYAHILDLIDVSFNAGYMADWVSHYGSFTGLNYSGDLDYISARGAFAMNTIDAAGGNTAFTVGGTNFSTVANNLVTLTGTAPVQITSILINGTNYPVTWSSISAWSIQVPLSSATNSLSIAGYDLAGNLVTNSTRTVIFNGAIADPATSVSINEIMYRPATTNGEFVELFNNSANFSFDLSGWRINGLGYTFPSGTILLPKNYLVLAKDRAAFVTAYGTTPTVFDLFTGNLDSNGETLTLFRPDPSSTNQESVVNRVRYETTLPWPVITNGASVQVIDSAQDNRRAANWTAVSDTPNTTPQWVRASASGVPRPSAISRPLYIYLQSAGDIYIDDVSVVSGTVAESGANLVINGGFENSLAPWTIGSDGNNSASTSGAGIARSGTRSLHLVAASGGTSQNSSIWQDFSSNIAVGATYTVSFWYLQSTNGGPLTVRFAGSGIDITTNPVPSASPVRFTPGALNSVAAGLPAFPSLWLNELQVVNLTGPTNNVGARTPWVEVYNPGSNALSLAGYFLSTNYTNLAQWAFPSNTTVPAQGFLVVWCDGQTNQSILGAPHTSFTLSSGSGSVALARLVNNVPQLVDYLNYSALAANGSYGDFPDAQPFYRQKMSQVTPGATNRGDALPATIVINEWMAANSTLTNPLDGKFDDWFELYNYGTNAVDLGGYYLTGDLTNKTKFKIPDTHKYVVPPQGFLLVWADNNNASNSVRPELHANFKLSKSGEAIGLFTADGTVVDAITFGPQTTDVSEGRFPDGAADLFFMPTPTPQTNNQIANTAPALAAISDKYIHAGQSVQFTASASDAEIASQTLIFSFNGAPAGANIHSGSGEFFWGTTNAAYPATHSVTVVVSDNGIPPLSDTKTFSVFISGPPQFSAVNVGGDGQIHLSFAALPGRNYQVQFKNTLADGNWTTLGETVVGSGSPITISDDATGRPQRFYKLLALP